MKHDSPNKPVDLVDLANLRLQVSDHAAAERLVGQALAADPHNLPALNTLAVIFHFTNRDRQAMQILRRTINARPEDPNAYYHLAGILCGKGELEQSLKTLERLFANASCSSEVAGTIFSPAFMLCDELQHILAQKNSEQASDAVEELRREVVHITGCPVDIGYGEVPQGLAAVARMASESGSGHHVIGYDPTLPDLVLPHVIAHELTHLELEARAQAAGKARTLAPCPATSEFLRNDLSPGSVVPRQTLHIILALRSVRLRLHDSIFHHRTAFGLDYMGTEAYPLATQLWGGSGKRPHETALCRQQRKPVLFVSPPVTFPALDQLRRHLAGDAAALRPLDQLEAEMPIETITYVLAGTVEHGDSLGNRGAIGPGEIQWMTAGRGIIHQEMPKGDRVGQMHGFQLWANLPSSLKMTARRYQEVKAGEIPEITDDDGTRARRVCGSFRGKRGPVDGIAADPISLDVTVPPRKRNTLPVETTRHAFTYVFAGGGKFCNASGPLPVPTEEVKWLDTTPPAEVDNRSLVLFDSGDDVVVQAGDDGIHFLLVSGKPTISKIKPRGVPCAELVGLPEPIERRAGCRQGRPRLQLPDLNPQERLGHLGFEWVGWRLPLEGLILNAHRAPGVSFQAERPSESSKRRPREDRVKGWGSRGCLEKSSTKETDSSSRASGSSTRGEPGNSRKGLG